MYKLYYQDFPGNRLDQQHLLDTVPNYKSGLWDETGHIHTFMSFLGIEYQWTKDRNDPDAVVVLEVDSAPASVTAAVIEHASKTYKRAIVMSATEPPPPGLLMDVMAKQYPNVLFVASGDHLFVSPTENFVAFPFFALRPMTVASQLAVHFIPDCNRLTAQKQFVFNHLSRFWAPNKYHMHYTIKNHFAHVRSKRALVSYRPIDWVEACGNARKNINLRDLDRIRTIHKLESNGDPSLNQLYPIEDYINRTNPEHADCYPAELIERDSYFNNRVLSHPRQAYTDCHLSLVTEVPKGRVELSNGTSVGYNYISEKTVQPILHGHIFLVNGTDGYNTRYIRDTMGFEIFDEVFEYADIEKNNSSYMTAYNIIAQLNQFNPECISDNASVIAEKIHHNRDLLTNPNSRLRQQLKQSFVNMLEKYRNLNT